ncbi:MAG TPA: S16 family serine protease, partial [Anaerolineaceae bacterium]|nr:S16 family serine protease [Anaerolineaceae bacterium]
HPNEIKVTKEAIYSIIRMYTKESGVRNLEREIGNICRKIATQITEEKDYSEEITPSIVRELLGKPKYLETEEIIRRTAYPGVAIGLAWTPFGGDILFIEATKMSGKKSFTITGSIGKVMQESAQIALSLVRSKAEEFEINPDIFADTEIHLHVPAGAQPKDGPSAGVTMFSALASLFTNRLIKSDLAMTGEISLKGQVLPVGGIKEKVLAAHRSGIKTVILPKLNEMDYEDIPEEVRKTTEFIFVDTIDDILESVLDEEELVPQSKKL